MNHQHISTSQKTYPMKKHTILPLITAALFTGAFTASADDITWSGPGTDYLTGGNWGGGNVPVLTGTDNAFIGGTAIYTPGGDYVLQGGSTLTITNGGSWTQAGGVAWIQAAGGNLVVNSGGSFDTGTAGNIIRDAGTSISVNGGTFSYNAGNFATGTGSFSLASGSTFNASGEFNLGDNFTFSSGTNYNGGSVITALANTYILTVDGSSLSVVDNGPSIAGFYGFDSINNYIDFTSNGGTITIAGVDGGGTEVQNAINTGMFRYNGAIDATNITYSDLGGGSFQVLAAIPEPSSFALLAGFLALGSIMMRRRK
jgi:hypothetical protein